MPVEFDMNLNDREALLRHCRTFSPDSGDAREDARLSDALEALAQALEAADCEQRALYQAQNDHSPSA